jgi:anti-sigma B factor antagonist
MEKTVKNSEEMVVKPGKDIVASTAVDFRQDLTNAVGSKVQKLVVDLNGVEIVDSVGIGVLAAAYNSLKKTGGCMAVSNVSSDIYHLFKVLRLDQHFEMTPAAG